MKARSYSLAEYKIIEHDSGVLWWESHAGLGSVIGGGCFVRGDILFIGPRESEDPGFLKREFLEDLRRLPKWEKTKYYCLSLEICLSGSGRKLTREEMVRWSAEGIHVPEKKSSSPTLSERGDYAKGSDSMEGVSYRLGRYEIIRKRDGRVAWKMPLGRRGLRGGTCIIAEDILFMGAPETEEPEVPVHDSSEYLKKLPEWRDTAYFCPGCALFDCGTGERRVRARRGRGRDEPARRLRREPVRTDRTGQETGTWKPGLKEWWAGIHLSGLEKRVVHAAAFLLGIVARILAVLVSRWVNRGGDHRGRDHYFGHRGDH